MTVQTKNRCRTTRALRQTGRLVRAWGISVVRLTFPASVSSFREFVEQFWFVASVDDPARPRLVSIPFGAVPSRCTSARSPSSWAPNRSPGRQAWAGDQSRQAGPLVHGTSGGGWRGGSAICGGHRLAQHPRGDRRRWRCWGVSPIQRLVVPAPLLAMMLGRGAAQRHWCRWSACSAGLLLQRDPAGRHNPVPTWPSFSAAGPGFPTCGSASSKAIIFGFIAGIVAAVPGELHPCWRAEGWSGDAGPTSPWSITFLCCCSS